jgi:hypothetical protein
MRISTSILRSLLGSVLVLVAACGGSGDATSGASGAERLYVI